MDALHGDLRALMIISHSILLRMRHILERVVEKIKTHYMLNNFPRQSCHYIFWVCGCIPPLVIRHENRTFCANHYIVICGLLGSIVFCHIISSAARFSGKVIEHKMCFDCLYSFYL